MNQKGQIFIKAGRIIDPSRGTDRVADLLLYEGTIHGLGDLQKPDGDLQIIDASGLIVAPGLVDLHCHLREPGYEYKETIASGTASAAAGGFTTVCAMPNTQPVIDSRAMVDFVLQKAATTASVRVLSIGAITINSAGLKLTEMADLANAGVVGFSDDGQAVANPNIMRQALSYSSALGLPIINHCEVPELSQVGSMNEGWVSTRLGLRGIPGTSEEIMVARDIALAELTNGRLHIAHVSTAGSVSLIGIAKEKGLNVTCEVTPHHLTLTDTWVLGTQSSHDPFDPLTKSAYNTNAKVAPPLRNSSDVEALVRGLRDGVIDFIATDHAPHSSAEKLCPFNDAANGISNFETALGSAMSLVHSGDLTLPLLIEKMSTSPAKFLGANFGTLKVGAPADVVIIDPKKDWLVQSSKFESAGKNTPLDGTSLKGKVMATIAGGKVKYLSQEIGNVH